MDKIKAVLINILLSQSTVLYIKNSKAFFTLLELVKKAMKIAINLANRLFSQFLITISTVSSNYINSANAAYNIINKDFFAYIVINKYLSDEFYGIMINTRTSNHSIIGYEQFVTYLKKFKYMTIYIFKTGVIYIQFSISSILYMKFVFFQTFIRYIKFYIIKANIFFLLLLANIDYLSVYFNNIDNLLVLKSICIPVI